MNNNCIMENSSPTEDDFTLLSDVEKKIITYVRSLTYGIVEITIHDGRIVQIEKREKFRVR